MSETLADRLDRVRSAIASAVGRRGPGPEVELVGVSKRQPSAAIREAHAAGLLAFGENYAQELRDKVEELSELAVTWHFIGALQSNKVKYVVGPGLVHTVDRVSLLEAIEKRAAKQGVEQRTLVEVNLGERQKAGADTDEIPALLGAFAETPHVRCEGLMIIPPAGAPEQTRVYFRQLRELRDTLAATPRPNVDLRHLSMGMSSDYEVAIEEGATLVRVGTAIFGPRPGS